MGHDTAGVGVARDRDDLAGQGPHADIDALDRMVIETLVRREVGDADSRLGGRDPLELIEQLEPRRGPERALDFMLRAGPYGDLFGPMYLIEAAQHGDGCANKYEREAYEASGGC